MSVASIAVYIALIGYVAARRMIGFPAGPAKKLFALPVIVAVIGWGHVTKGLHKPVDVTFTVAGCAISLVLGLARGGADRLSARAVRPADTCTAEAIDAKAAAISELLTGFNEEPRNIGATARRKRFPVAVALTFCDAQTT